MQESNLVSNGLMETREIGIDGMTCEHCVRRVEKALRGQKGVTEVIVDREAARARVTFDTGQTNIPQLHSTLLKSGYKPK